MANSSLGVSDSKAAVSGFCYDDDCIIYIRYIDFWFNILTEPIEIKLNKINFWA